MYVSIPATSHLDRKMPKRSPKIVACSMRSVSEDDRKSERATSGISCELFIPPLSLPDPAWNRPSRLGWNIISKATAKNVCFHSCSSHLDRKMPKRSPKIGMKYHFETLSVKIPKSFCIITIKHPFQGYLFVSKNHAMITTRDVTDSWTRSLIRTIGIDQIN